MGTSHLRHLAFAGLIVASIATMPQAALAQGPGPVGITRAVHAAGVRQLSLSPDNLAARRRVSPAGAGALIGTAVGLVIGYLGTRPPGPGEGDGLGVEVMLGMGLVGAGVGALLGYMIGQR